jgi:hypothetical protein
MWNVLSFKHLLIFSVKKQQMFLRKIKQDAMATVVPRRDQNQQQGTLFGATVVIAPNNLPKLSDTSRLLDNVQGQVGHSTGPGISTGFMPQVPQLQVQCTIDVTAGIPL